MAVHSGLCRTWPEAPETDFLATQLVLGVNLGLLLYEDVSAIRATQANLANNIEGNMSFPVTSPVSVEPHELSFSSNKAN